MAELKVRNLTYIYSEGTPFCKKALDDVSLDIENSSITGIIGHTGSGKSTLLQTFNGLLKPKSGSVLLDGNDIFKNKKTLREAKFRIGLVFQYPEYQLFDETVRKDISFGPHNMGLSESEIEERIESACEFTGFDQSLLNKSPFELSGGQKRRAAIAGIIAMKPEILVLDEPASGLDPEGRRSIFKGLIDYRDKTGASVVIVSHSMEDMAEYAEHIIVMEKGKVILDGNKKEVFSNADILEKSGLGLPEVTKVVRILSENGIQIPGDVYTVKDAAQEIAKLFGKEMTR